MQAHPLADIFPLLLGPEFRSLVDDVRRNGVQQPIVTHEGLILDGRNRWRAAQAAGVECPSIEYEGDDPLAFVVSLNLARRHLTESQRAAVAARIANMRHGGDRKSDQPASLPLDPADLVAPTVSQSEAAAMLNVSERSVRSARTVLDHGTPELVAAVDEGKVSVSAAADVATLPKPEQAQIVARGEKEILAAAKAIRAEKAEVRRAERVERIVTQAQELPAKKYAVIYADPPWRYEHSATVSRDIENQYPTMSHEELLALPVADLALPDCVLYLWATAPKLTEALALVESWGFAYRTCAVWDKQHIGMGYYFRIQHELLLVATRGDIPAPAPSDRPASLYAEKRGEHSAKPEWFARAIEAAYPSLPRVELFNRGGRKGWDVWGNQSSVA